MENKLPENNSTSKIFSFQPLCTADQAASFLNLPKETIYEHARTGLLPCVRIGRSVRFKVEDLEAFVNSGGQAFEGTWRKTA